MYDHVITESMRYERFEGFPIKPQGNNLLFHHVEGCKQDNMSHTHLLFDYF
jgi:hypothetical protein